MTNNEKTATETWEKKNSNEMLHAKLYNAPRRCRNLFLNSSLYTTTVDMGRLRGEWNVHVSVRVLQPDFVPKHRVRLTVFLVNGVRFTLNFRLDSLVSRTQLSWIRHPGLRDVHDHLRRTRKVLIDTTKSPEQDDSQVNATVRLRVRCETTVASHCQLPAPVKYWGTLALGRHLSEESYWSLWPKRKKHK